MTYFDFWDMTPTVNRISYRYNLVGAVDSPVIIDAPGFGKDDIEAEVLEGRFLYLSGEKTVHGEKRTVKKTVSLPNNVDTDTIKISVDNGVIAIEFKLKGKESRKIAIK